MMAVGQDLPPLPGVNRLRLVFHSALTPPDDDLRHARGGPGDHGGPHHPGAPPGVGETGAREFLIQHPPRWRRPASEESDPCPQSGPGLPAAGLRRAAALARGGPTMRQDVLQKAHLLYEVEGGSLERLLEKNPTYAGLLERLGQAERRSWERRAGRGHGRARRLLLESPAKPASRWAS